MSNKIPAVHLVNEGAYLLERTWGGSYEVDGMKLPSSGAVVQDITKVFKVTERRGELLHYADADGSRLTSGDYEDKKTELLAASTEIDDGRIFTDLESEFAWRKFSERWKPVFAPNVIERTPIEVEISEVRTTSGDADITSLWNAPSVHSDSRLYQVMRDGVTARTLREMCAKAELPLDIPTHSGIRFAQISGNYAFSDEFDFKGLPYIGTLAQCKAEKDRVVDAVTRVVRVHIAKKEGTPLRGVAQVILQLRAVQSNLSGVRPKQDTGGLLIAARKAVNEIIESLEKQI